MVRSYTRQHQQHWLVVLAVDRGLGVRARQGASKLSSANSFGMLRGQLPTSPICVTRKSETLRSKPLEMMALESPAWRNSGADRQPTPDRTSFHGKHSGWSGRQQAWPWQRSAEEALALAGLQALTKAPPEARSDGTVLPRPRQPLPVSSRIMYAMYAASASRHRTWPPRRRPSSTKLRSASTLRLEASKLRKLCSILGYEPRCFACRCFIQAA